MFFFGIQYNIFKVDRGLDKKVTRKTTSQEYVLQEHKNILTNFFLMTQINSVLIPGLILCLFSNYNRFYNVHSTLKKKKEPWRVEAD